MTEKEVRDRYPSAPEQAIRAAIRHQHRLSLTLDNLKCLNDGCQNMRGWLSSNTKFKNCCSTECTKLNISLIQKQAREKANQTYFERTGFLYTTHNPDSEERRKKTNLEKYGVENIFSKVSFIIEKRLEKTGFKFATQNPKIKQHLKQTSLNKYGVPNPMQSLKIKQKIKDKCVEKYGVDNVAKIDSVIQKRKETYFGRTGFVYPSHNPEVKEKIKQDSLLIYGTTNSSNKHIEHFRDWDNKQFWLANFIINNNFNLYKCMEYFNCKQPAAHNQIKKLGIEYTKLGGTSHKERLIANYLQSLDLKIITNTKSIITPLELDIYLPELGLAIEYNGSYWHSYHETIGTSPKQLDYQYMKYRHQQKSLACLEAGIRLLHIYEDDTEDEILNKIETFLLYEPDHDTEWDLDAGCYPLGQQFEIIKPESRIVLGDRLLFDAGKIKIN